MIFEDGGGGLTMDVSLINEEIKSSVMELKEVFKYDPVIKKFFQTEDQVETLLDSTVNLIREVLKYEDFEESLIEKTVKDLSDKYIAQGFPYIPFLNCVDKIRNAIVKKISDKQPSLVEAVRFRFDVIKNFVAKVYIFYEIDSLEFDVVEEIVCKKLYHSLLDWFLEFKEFILEENYEKAVALATRKCEFEEIMEGLSYQTKCVNPYICASIEKNHALMHEVSKNFSYLMSKKEFVSAYIVLTELKQILRLIIANLEKLHIIFLNDAENIFFRFVENFTYSPGIKTLLLVNIKNLKVLNSTYSQRVINHFLNEFENELVNFAESSLDTVCVKGIVGDFFLLSKKPPVETMPSLTSAINKFLKDFNEFNSIKPEIITVGLSIEPYTNVTGDELRKVLYHLKLKAIEKNLPFYLVDKTERIEILDFINRRYRDIRFIQKAFENKKVDVFFQPIIECKNGTRRIYSLEALARLISEEKFIPAGVFIDLIYEMDLIEELDKLVLSKITSYAEEVKEICGKVSINVSPRSLRSERFLNILEDTCRKLFLKGVTPVIELTEQVFIEHLDAVRDLHYNYGVRFTVDDFGAGYSSLRTVVDLTENELLEKIKIDGSLVRDISKSKKLEQLVKIIVNIAHELGVKTVAEYIEDEELLTKLRLLGVDLFQGYYLGVPQHITSLLTHYKEKVLVK